VGNKCTSFHLLDIDIGCSWCWHHPFPVDSTVAALYSPVDGIARNKVPWEAVIRLLRTLFGVSRMTVSQGPTDHSTAFAKKGSLICHQKPLQQIGQRPLRCRGLHLSLVSPQIRADSGAMCWTSSYLPTSRCASLACLIKHWRTNRLKFGNRSAILAVSSSRLMVLFVPMILASKNEYMYVFILMSSVSRSAAMTCNALSEA